MIAKAFDAGVSHLALRAIVEPVHKRAAATAAEAGKRLRFEGIWVDEAKRVVHDMNS